MTPSIKHKGTHFSELLAEHYNAELLALSRGGCSNNAICVQIEQAISLNADFIIIGCTSSDRIEIPIAESALTKKFLKSWNVFFESNTQKEKKQYDKKKLLANFSYDKHPDLSALNNFMVNPVLISESINNLIFQEVGINNHYNITPQIKKALEYYVTNLYDVKFKKQLDCWCFTNILRKLFYEKKINFLVFTQELFNEEFEDEISWLDKKHIANIHGPYGLEFKPGVRYHTTTEAQEYVAKQLIKIIDERFN